MVREGAWSVVPFGRRTAAENLAETERLVEAVAAGTAGPTLRWYGYTGRAAITGVGQAPGTVATDLEARGIDVVRRLSGGATVLADAEMLALDACLPAASPLAGTDVVEAYRWFGEAWRTAIVAVTGEVARTAIRLVPVEEARRDRSLAREAPNDPVPLAREATCFGFLSPYEVAWQAADGTARKLVGFSQVRRRGVVLFQAGVHWRFDAEVMTSLLAIDGSDRAAVVADLKGRIADLAEAGLDMAAQDDLITAFVTAATRALGEARGA